MMGNSDTGHWLGDAANGFFAGFGAMKNMDSIRKNELQRFEGQTRRARNDDLRSMYANQASTYAKEGIKMKFNRLIADQPKKLYPVFKAGGSVNVVPRGKLHRENNDIAGKDKGIPVVDPEGKKLFEIEKEELILTLKTTEAVEALVEKYNKSEDDSILEKLGQLLTAELLSNTQDNTEKFV